MLHDFSLITKRGLLEKSSAAEIPNNLTIGQFIDALNLKAKHFWGGKGGLGSKMGNRFATLAGLGTVGLGIKAYLESQRAQQPSLYPGPKLAGSYVQDAATTPAPPSQPRVSAPSPGVKSIPKITPGVGASVPKAQSEGRTEASETSSEKKADDVLFPLLAGSVGGAGGWVAGKKFLEPLLESKERSLAAAIMAQEQRLANIRNLKKLAPFGAATAGAILLAALAASKARQSERERNLQPYDPTRSGFLPNNQVAWGNTHPEIFY